MNTLDSTEPSPVPLDMHGIIGDLRSRCPLPLLMHRMGLGKYAKKSCRSPFRMDKKASWGIVQREGRWFWKDFGTDEAGDEINFIIRAKKYPPHTAFQDAVEYWQRIARRKAGPDEAQIIEGDQPQARERPNLSGFGPGTDDQLMRLSALRKIDPLGLLLAQMQGLLVFGRLGPREVYGITDSSGYLLEVRRMDGECFPAWGELGERKCHSVKGSRKDWPVGLREVGTKQTILLVEGGPDLLSACEVIAREGAIDRVAPMAILSAGATIADDALPFFKDKHVRILPHNDEAGRKAAARWQAQLLKAGAAKVDFLMLSAGDETDTVPFKDLNDYLPLYRHELAEGLAEARLL